MRPHTMPNGYLRLGLRHEDGTRENIAVHRMVCEAFHGPAPTLTHHAAHWDGNRKNNIPNNLRWATCSENHADKIRHGTTNRGLKRDRALGKFIRPVQP
jgi:hypothetical protein